MPKISSLLVQDVRFPTSLELDGSDLAIDANQRWEIDEAIEKWTFPDGPGWAALRASGQVK